LIGITPQVPLQPTGYSSFDGVEMDAKGNIYVSEIVRNEIWVLSPDGSQRILIANKMNAPLDNNTSLVLKGARGGRSHRVCMKGFTVPK